MIETKNAASPLTASKTTEEAGKEVLNADSIQTSAFMGNGAHAISEIGSAWLGVAE